MKSNMVCNTLVTCIVVSLCNRRAGSMSEEKSTHPAACLDDNLVPAKGTSNMACNMLVTCVDVSLSEEKGHSPWQHAVHRRATTVLCIVC
jgi:hypothetical protein